MVHQKFIFHHFREGATYAFKLMNFAEIFFKGISQTAWTYKYIAEKKSLNGIINYIHSLHWTGAEIVFFLKTRKTKLQSKDGSPRRGKFLQSYGSSSAMLLDTFVHVL